MKRKEHFFRATDLVRLLIVLLISSAIIVPKHIKQKEEKYWANYYAWIDNVQKESKKEYEEWKAMSADEQFVWFVKDIGKKNGEERNVRINEKTKSIYIYVLGIPVDKMPDMQGYINYEMKMASIAKESGVTKEIYVVGVSESGKEYWAINKDGVVIDFNKGGRYDGL